MAQSAFVREGLVDWAGNPLVHTLRTSIARKRSTVRAARCKCLYSIADRDRTLDSNRDNARPWRS
jgi:hypothetical protein